MTDAPAVSLTESALARGEALPRLLSSTIRCRHANQYHVCTFIYPLLREMETWQDHVASALFAGSISGWFFGGVDRQVPEPYLVRRVMSEAMRC